VKVYHFYFMDYKTSGVDIEAGREFVSEIKQAVEETHTSNVIEGIGGFGGLFRIPIDSFKKPVLVSGTDGVGTKLELAQSKNFHFEVGIDLVAMCMNDIITSGAKPLFFLDYIATGKLDKKKLLRVVQGISYGCGENNCSLLGGETAEMPGFYSKNKYDLAGFCVGIVDEDKLINGKKVSENDLIIALKSNGVHSNGFSLVRKIIQNNNQIDKEFEKVSHLNFYDELLKPTKIYNNVINQILSENIEIKQCPILLEEEFQKIYQDVCLLILFLISIPVLGKYPFYLYSLKRKDLFLKKIFGILSILEWDFV